ncbi:hypothetical protein FVA95_25280 [Pseudonocardia sp. EV170527-09]|uniref:hypothetical protein n=1 Tax=Pseudonocardia sp. EV170527-09 TaxID=2603411 RepID=UPI0011F2D213|nr:hypothetical protein [Pseudonocardia sp. EV170527-09]KAA1016805.1 hypothetical protein FVA95_25280 [Pseudonocardia sp. EV170527-09]
MRVGDGPQHVPVRARLQDEPEPPARVRGEDQRDPDELGVRRAADLVAVVVSCGDTPGLCNERWFRPDTPDLSVRRDGHCE